MTRAFSSKSSTAPLLLILSLLLLNACAALQAERPGVATHEREIDRAARLAALRAYDNWRLSGRVGIQRGDEGFSADLEWRQHGALFDLRIIAPLNGGTFALQGSDTTVSLTTPAGEIFVAADAETLMAKHVGWVIPVSGARYWVRGIPAPQAAVEQERHDADGRWQDFAQSGWRISVLDYFEDLSPQLPRKLFLSRDTLKVRMVVKHWEQR